MMRQLLAVVILLALPVYSHATTVVYDSLSGYVPENTPGANPSWLNGDAEQGIRISRSHVGLRLTKAEFFFRSDFLVPLTTSTTMRFYADQNGLPADLLATVVDSIAVSARSVEKVSIELSNILLPDDPIWVTWQFGSSSSAGGVTLGATTSIGTDFATRAYRSWSDESWITDSPFAAHGGGPPLRLSAVPEPSGTPLCVLLIALLLFLQRRPGCLSVR
jgi:hypothetical protein